MLTRSVMSSQSIKILVILRPPIMPANVPQLIQCSLLIVQVNAVYNGQCQIKLKVFWPFRCLDRFFPGAWYIIKMLYTSPYPDIHPIQSIPLIAPWCYFSCVQLLFPMWVNRWSLITKEWLNELFHSTHSLQLAHRKKKQWISDLKRCKSLMSRLLTIPSFLSKTMRVQWSDVRFV